MFGRVLFRFPASSNEILSDNAEFGLGSESSECNDIAWYPSFTLKKSIEYIEGNYLMLVDKFL
ncbi:hypothetical protein D3C80_941120 [compost metagenome]